ncbi:MAG: hypothetical protein Q7O66_18875 [Dehalococcoidia bacterium]|nr:hypothetical protein [Dehalococcoidia bacterium]
MTRIADLQKKYPTIPLEVIVKWEILNTGVGDSDDLDKVSQWLRRNNVGTYQTYDHDVTLKDQAVKRPERIKDGHMLRPNTMYMANGIGAKIRMDSRSPYRIKDRGDGRMAIFEGEDMVDMDVYFPPKPPLEEALTSKGTLVTDLVNLNQRCFFIVPVRYCEYFATGDQCKFCNFNGTQEDAKSIGINRSVTISLDETVEAYKILGSDVKYPEGKLEMGGFMNSETEAKIYMDFVGALANALPYKPSYNLVTQAMSRKNMQRLKDVGLEAIALQMEAFDPA